MNTNFERGERIRNYSWSNNIVTDYRTKRKFNLQKYFSGAGFEMIEEIQEEYTHLKNCERNVALFQKYNNDVSEELFRKFLSDFEKSAF